MHSVTAKHRAFVTLNVFPYLFSSLTYMFIVTYFQPCRYACLFRLLLSAPWYMGASESTAPVFLAPSHSGQPTGLCTWLLTPVPGPVLRTWRARSSQKQPCPRALPVVGLPSASPHRKGEDAQGTVGFNSQLLGIHTSPRNRGLEPKGTSCMITWLV